MFSASIPEKVYFQETKYNSKWKERITSITTRWINLPIKNANQPSQIFLEKKKRYSVYSSNDTNAAKYVNNFNYIEKENDPIKLKVIGYIGNKFSQSEIKNEVVVSTEDDLCFTIGVDVLTNALLSGPVIDGFLPGEYIFAKFGNTVKAIQVDSELHQGVLQFSAEKENKKITTKKMNVGEVYATPAGNMGLLLGFVNTETMKVELAPGVERYFSPKNNMPNDVKKFKVNFERKNLQTLWFSVGNKNERAVVTKKQIEEDYLDALHNKMVFHFSVKDAHSFNNKIDIERIDIDYQTIKNIRNFVSQKVEAWIKNDRVYRANPDLYINSNSPSKKKTLNPPDKIRHFDALSTAKYANMLNMVPYGMDPIRSDLCKVFEEWNK